MTSTPDLTQASANPRRAHLTHIDFLRIFAIFLVILDHLVTDFMPTDEQGTIKSCLLFFFYQIIKTAVPIFFMISGALLLPREESYGQLFRKRILRFPGVIILFWTLQLTADSLINGTPLSLRSFIRCCYGCNYVPLQAWACWFLYAYLAMLLLLPLLRHLAHSMRDRTCSGYNSSLLHFSLRLCACLRGMSYQANYANISRLPVSYNPTMFLSEQVSVLFSC